MSKGEYVPDPDDHDLAESEESEVGRDVDGNEYMRITALDDEGNPTGPSPLVGLKDSPAFTFEPGGEGIVFGSSRDTSLYPNPSNLVTFANSAGVQINAGGTYTLGVDLPAAQKDVNSLTERVDQLESLVGEMWEMLVSCVEIIKTQQAQTNLRRGRVVKTPTVQLHANPSTAELAKNVAEAMQNIERDIGKAFGA